MPCCCCPNEENKYEKSSDEPPSKNSMERDMDDDERAVDWWRNRQKSPQDAEDEDNNSPSRTRSLENSKNRMQQRNPLEKPYDIQRELPLNPIDGSILHPTPKETAPAVAVTPNAVEVFEPEISQGGQSIPLAKDEDENREQLTVVAAEEEPTHANQDSPESQKETVSKISGGSAHGKVDSSGIQATPPSKAAVGKTPITEKGKQKKNSENRLNAVDPDEDRRDHLSDVPSDVDSVTRERYLLACRVLKSTLIQKEKTVVPIEREFIMSLLGDYDNHSDVGSSVVSEDQVSAIERAQLRLDNDPLFRSKDGDEKERNSRPPSPASAASVQMQEDQSGREEESELAKKDMTRGKKRSLTLKKPLAKLLTNASNACNPKSPEDAGAADLVLIVHDDEEESDKEENSEVRLVRFDGWSGNKSAEFPFKILDADDPKVHPRVLTPPIMEALRGFFPFGASESNFWLKFSLNRDGASLATLLSTVRASMYTIIAVETMHGEVFGSFTATPWRTGTKWFGIGEAFLWRLKKSRMTSPRNSKRDDFDNEMEVYPYTGNDDLVQYCTNKTIAVGGGDWRDDGSPFDDEPKGIGLMIDGDLAGGETNSCATFANPRLCKTTTASNEFSISNLEMWTLTPCLTVEAATKMEMKKLFIEKHIQKEL